METFPYYNVVLIIYPDLVSRQLILVECASVSFAYEIFLLFSSVDTVPTFFKCISTENVRKPVREKKPVIALRVVQVSYQSSID